MESLKGPKSPARQCGDVFKSKLQGANENFPIPPTAVGGLFKSSLDSNELANILILPKHLASGVFRNPDYNNLSKVTVSLAVDQRAGLEQSTNCRWWDSDSLQPSLIGRSDLNNLRTAVRGIPDFCEKAFESIP